MSEASMMSTQLDPSDFATPDRAGLTGLSSTTTTSKNPASLKDSVRGDDTARFVTPTEPRDESKSTDNSHEDRCSGSVSPTLPTHVGSHVDSPPAPTKGSLPPLPPPSGTTLSVNGKHVRFGAGSSNQDGVLEHGKAEGRSESPTAERSKRGLVSRRGGRYVSPGRPAMLQSSPPSPITSSSDKKEKSRLEYKPYSSSLKRDENDTVPSLCSINSGGLQSEQEKAKTSEVVEEKRKKAVESYEGSSRADGAQGRRPVSISCDASMGDSTSPLTSHEELNDRNKSPVKGEQSSRSVESVDSVLRSKSPIPPTEKTKKYFKSPVPESQFQTLPSLEDAKLSSPVGIFLSPHPTPLFKIKNAPSFDKSEVKEEKHDDPRDSDSKPRDYANDRFDATPTDFSLDYGKGHTANGSFETTNMLAWLQSSPTGIGLFSPGGGLGSIMNTPRGSAPRTPRTPIVTNSFFFTDVAGLPRSGDFTPNKAESSKGSKRGISNICISPLASSKNRYGAHGANTPINYKEVFASPHDSRHMPMLGDSPVPGVKGRPGPQQRLVDSNLDSIDGAERDLMEDEDLHVLLQLAGNTPGSSRERGPPGSSGGAQVFRSENHHKEEGRESLPGLQLPFIGDRAGDSSASRLSRKPQSRDHGDDHSFGQSGLTVRQSNSISSAYDKGRHHSAKEDVKPGPEEPKSKKSTKKTISTPYHMRHPYTNHPGTDVYPYHGGRPTASMRVVVSGHPPPRSGGKSGPTSHKYHGPASPGRHHPTYPHGDAPYQAPHLPYPHHAHYPPPLPSSSVYPPYHGHGPTPYPPPHHPHMPHMYGQPPPGKGAKMPPKKPGKGQKRSSPDSKGGATKKEKKVTKKKPKRSPQPQDRKRSAEKIEAVNAASGGNNDRAAALAAAILRGVTMRPSGKWQAQLYFAGKSRYIGVFDTREKAALAYEIAREKLKSEKAQVEGALSPKATEAAVNSARKAAFDGVNERDPRLSAGGAK